MARISNPKTNEHIPSSRLAFSAHLSKPRLSPCLATLIGTPVYTYVTRVQFRSDKCDEEMHANLHTINDVHSPLRVTTAIHFCHDSFLTSSYHVRHPGTAK